MKGKNVKKIDKPKFGVKDVYPDCIKHIRKKHDMEKVLPDLIQHEKEYEFLADNKRLAELNIITDDYLKKYGISKKDMVYTYNGGMLKQEWEGRYWYNKLVSLSRRCPYCDVGIVTTLDHYLEKTISLGTTVTPINLIPSCHDCNRYKNGEERYVWHPYFDELIMFRWLHADYLKYDHIRYNVVIPVEYENTYESQIIRNSFEVFKLAEVYGAQAIVYLNDIRVRMKELKDCSMELLKEDLRGRYRSSLAANLNSFTTALYECLMDSDEYIDDLG